MFLQAAGSDFDNAHDLVAAVTEAIQTPHEEQAPDAGHVVRNHHTSADGFATGFAPGHPGLDPERIAGSDSSCTGGYTDSRKLARGARCGPWRRSASPLADVDVEWIASAAARIGNENLLLEAAGVAFAFNTINRIADARRVQLEYRFLRQLKPIQGWVKPSVGWFH